MASQLTGDVRLLTRQHTRTIAANAATVYQEASSEHTSACQPRGSRALSQYGAANLKPTHTHARTHARTHAHTHIEIDIDIDIDVYT